MNSDCTLCIDYAKKTATFFDENETCFYVEFPHRVLEGWGMILPKRCVETVFDLSPNEFTDSLELLKKHKRRMHKELSPDGFNVGWNCYEIGGQDTMHAHMHLIPRFADEPLAGKGIRYWLKQKENLRPSRV